MNIVQTNRAFVTRGVTRLLLAMRRMLASALALSILMVSVQSSVVQAAMVSTETLVQEHRAQYDRERILDAVSQEQARATLVSLGVSPEDVEARIKNMTPAELAQFNAQIDELPAGGASVFAVVIFILVLLIILDLLGATDIFPAIRPIQVN